MLTDSMKQEMDIAALVDLYTYLDDYTVNAKGDNLGELMDFMAAKNKKVTKKPEYQAIKAALDKHPEWKKLELLDQSSDSTTPDIWTDDKIQAVCFKYPKGNGVNDYYVGYRGTGDGRWRDNAEGMTEALTPMQDEAADYFDHLFSTHDELNTVHDNGGRLIVTGHSKGGNEAQYVTMASAHRNFIDNCYSYDGQGFSKKADDKFQEDCGEELYNLQKDKIYSICGENDPVHELGKKQIVSDDHTYYVGYTDSGGFSCHDLTAMLYGAGGYTGIRWSEKNGGHGEQGYMGKFAKRLNKELQGLDDDDLRSSALITMAIIDFCMQVDHPLNMYNLSEQKLTFRDLLRFGDKGIPIVIKTLIKTPEGRKLLWEMAKDGLESSFKKFGPRGTIAFIIIVSAIAIRFALAGAILVIASKIIKYAIEFIEKIKNVGKKIIECAKNIYDGFIKTYKEIRSWIHNTFNKGAKYSRAHTYIYVDTTDLRCYAERLGSLNNRLIELESRLHSLYSKLSPANQLVLQSVDSEIGNSRLLTRSRNYLNTTADLFTEAEEKIASALK